MFERKNLKVLAMKRRELGAIFAMTALAGCAGGQANGVSKVDYDELVLYAKTAIAALKVIADGLVTAGQLSSDVVAKVESDAQAAVTALSDAVEPSDPRSIAQNALTALQGMLGVIPASAIPPDVLAAVQLAMTVLTAFLDLDPATASQVRASQSRLSVRLRP